MFDDYNRYFKGNPTHAPHSVDVRDFEAAQFPLPGRDLSLRSSGRCAASATAFSSRPKKQHPAVNLEIDPLLSKERAAALPPAYIRSIIALPNAEHESCVDPGIKRAKS